MGKSLKIVFMVFVFLFAAIIFSCANSGGNVKPAGDDETTTEETPKGDAPEEEKPEDDTPDEVKPTYEEWTKIGKAEFANTRDKNETTNDIIKLDETYTNGIKVIYSELPDGIEYYTVYVYEFGKGGEIFGVGLKSSYPGRIDDKNGYFIFPYLKAGQKYHFCFEFKNDANEMVIWDEIECSAGSGSLGEIEVEVGNGGMSYNEYGDLIFTGLDSIKIKLNDKVVKKNNIVGNGIECYTVAAEWKWLFYFTVKPNEKSLNLYENVPDWCDLYREPKDSINVIKLFQNYYWSEDDKTTWEYKFCDTAVIVPLDNPKLKTLEEWRETMGVSAPVWEKLSLDNISRFEGTWEWNHIWFEDDIQKYDYFSLVIDKDGNCLYKQVYSQFMGTGELSGSTVEDRFNLKDRITVDEDFKGPREFEVFGDTNIRALLRDDDLRPIFTRYVEE